MYGIRSVVVADASSRRRGLLLDLLRAHFPSVVGAHDEDSALAAVAGPALPALLLVDMSLPPSGGVVAIERCLRVPQRPTIVALTGSPNLAEESQVTLMGAVGYLARPIGFSDIVSVLRRSRTNFASIAPRARAPRLTMATACDETGAPCLEWIVRDLSVTGAFLITRAPIAVHEPVQIRIQLGEDHVLLSALVVRVQEPSWSHDGGVGVAFRDMDPESARKLERFVSEAIERQRAIERAAFRPRA